MDSVLVASISLFSNSTYGLELESKMPANFSATSLREVAIVLTPTHVGGGQGLAALLERA